MTNLLVSGSMAWDHVGKSSKKGEDAPPGEKMFSFGNLMAEFILVLVLYIPNALL
jgi:hypothetical protein